MTDVAKLVRRIEALSPSDRFRLVADLLEARQARLALTLARRTTTELGAALCLLRPSPKSEGT